MMKSGYIFRVTAMLLSVVALASCVKENELTGDEIESHALRAWIKKNRPELLENKHSSGFYIDVLAWGNEGDEGDDNDFGDKPIMEQDSVWMFYTMTGYDLDGNVCLTRNDVIARMQGSFTKQTHYVPYMNYSGQENALSLLESTYQLARNSVILGDSYVASHQAVCPSNEFKLRRGSKVRIYAPSTIAYGSSGTSMEGGYEGQYSLDSNVPVILDIEVMRAIKNPSTLEVDMVCDLVGAADEESDGQNGWTLAINDVETDSDTSSSDSDGEEENKNLIGLYYNLLYEPTVNGVGLRHLMPHIKDTSVSSPYKDSGIYADMAGVDAQIEQILADKFSGKVLAKEDMNDDNLITASGTAKVWYIARFLDGFVLDTNIKEVAELVFDEASSTSSISYCADSNSSEYITAWQYCIPKMHFGQWAMILTTSGYAYGSSGVSGSTTTTTTYDDSYLNYYNYYNTYNSMYYGNYYYGGYYGYNYPIATSTSVDTSTINTEVLGYTPLLFYIYIEPNE